MFLVIQPPFIFNYANLIDPLQQKGNASKIDVNEPVVVSLVGTSRDWNTYLIGVVLALMCSFQGGAVNVSVAFCQDIPSTVLVFYSGLFGLGISFIGPTFDASQRLLSPQIVDIPWQAWGVMIFVSFSGLIAFVTMTKSLQMLQATIVSSIRSSEIILAYIIQTVVAEQAPSILAIAGAGLTVVSIIGLSMEEYCVKRMPESIQGVC